MCDAQEQRTAWVDSYQPGYRNEFAVRKYIQKYSDSRYYNISNKTNHYPSLFVLTFYSSFLFVLRYVLIFSSCLADWKIGSSSLQGQNTEIFYIILQIIFTIMPFLWRVNVPSTGKFNNWRVSFKFCVLLQPYNHGRVFHFFAWIDVKNWGVN